MKRAWLVLLLGALAVGAAAPAQAQAQTMADALGKPLPKSDLPTGTMTVRVVDGEISSPVIGADVTLLVDGKPRAARTNESGRATFADLPPGAKVQAQIAGASGPVSSLEFAVPAAGGVAVMLSTKPFAEPMGGAGPGAMAPGQRPPPRQMAGKPRPEQGDPVGQVTVRLSFNDWDDTAGLADRPVIMAALASDDRVALKVVRTDAGGRAVFSGLDTSGNTAYYAMTLLTRTGAEDRLMSDPILPGAEAGVRVMLSGDRGTAAPVDDLSKVLPQPTLPPGQVVAAFVGAPQEGAVAELYDLSTNQVVASKPIERSRALPSTIAAQFGPVAPVAGAAPGTLAVTVKHKGGGRGAAPLQGIALHVSEVSPGPAAGAAGPEVQRTTVATGATDAAGVATLAGLRPGAEVEVTVVVEGRPFSSSRFVVDKAAGAALEITADWQVLGMYQAVFDGVDFTKETAYLVQTRMHDQLYRSGAVMLGMTRGAAVPLYILPRVAVTFELDGRVDDEYFAFQGTFIVQNFGWSPYAGPSEGIRIPMPSGATGLVLADMDKEWVVAEPSDFRLTRPVPPWGGSFRGAFSLPISDGTMTWDLQLPFGSYESSLGILDNPGMRLDVPTTQKVDRVPSMDGSRTFHALRSITIQPKQRMVFRIHGLPVPPGWPRVARIGAGIAVLLMLGIGAFFVIAWARKPEADGVGASPAAEARAARKQRKARIEELLDQVAALDRERGESTASTARRDQLVAELEALYRADERAAEKAAEKAPEKA